MWHHGAMATSGMERLIGVVQELSLARDLEGVMAIVRRAARELTGADGATFVLRDGDRCHYADEDAIEPLWKGQRFPLSACISGWAMLHRECVAIDDIYADARIPHDAYRPTFVKSLVMVPIRTVEPVGAIGNYWATRHTATPEEIRLLAALADSTSIAMENVQLYSTLERRVEERTAELAASRAELAAQHEALVRLQRHKEELSALLVHDLKSPASGIIMAARSRLRSRTLAETDRPHWRAVLSGAEIIDRMALNLLDVSRSEDGAFAPRIADVAISGLLDEVGELMTPLAEGRNQTLALAEEAPDLRLRADGELLRRVLQNLIDNALRHGPSGGTVRVTARPVEGAVELRVSDEGEGIPEGMRERVFDKYTRLDATGATRGSAGRGLGLTFCRLAAEAHGGSIHAEANAPQGSVFVLRVPTA
jgi:signal transduction histidine kinase